MQEHSSCNSTGARLRGTTPRSRSGQWLRGATPHPRSGVAAERSYLISRLRAAAERSYHMSKVRSSGCTLWSSREEIPNVQGKRNPSKMVGAERGHQRTDRLKPQSQTTSQSDHKEHSFAQLSDTKPCRVGPPKTDGSWRRGLTECVLFTWK